MNLGVDAPVDDVFEDVPVEKLGCRRHRYLFAVAISRGSQCRASPSSRICRALNEGCLSGARIVDAVCVEGCAFHLLLVMSSMLTGVPSCAESSVERSIAFLQQQIARLLGGDSDRCGCRGGASPAPSAAGRRRADRRCACLPVQDRIESSKARAWPPHRPRRMGRHSAPAVAGYILARSSCAREAGGLDRLLQQRLVFAGKAVARAQRVEAIGELVFVDQGRSAPISSRRSDGGIAMPRSARSQAQS